MANEKHKCFIIMPITTSEDVIEDYKADDEHFIHILEHLFVPAIEIAGFDPIKPKVTGSDIIHAEIIKCLSTAELVLCDMSILNPNVFFELGIRTALNKPVCLVVDDKTTPIPFDTGIINFHTYSSSLLPWNIKDEINDLAEHIKKSFNNNYDKLNSLWKYFGVAQTGVFKPEESTMVDKIDLLMKEVEYLKKKLPLELTTIKSQTGQGVPSLLSDVPQGALAEVEKYAITKTLMYTGGNKSQAAQRLGISRSTLREKMKLYDIS
jgi:hypothetical protein